MRPMKRKAVSGIEPQTPHRFSPPAKGKKTSQCFSGNIEMFLKKDANVFSKTSCCFLGAVSVGGTTI